MQMKRNALSLIAISGSLHAMTIGVHAKPFSPPEVGGGQGNASSSLKLSATLYLFETSVNPAVGRVYILGRQATGTIENIGSNDCIPSVISFPDGFFCRDWQRTESIGWTDLLSTSIATSGISCPDNSLRFVPVPTATASASSISTAASSVQSIVVTSGHKLLRNSDGSHICITSPCDPNQVVADYSEPCYWRTDRVDSGLMLAEAAAQWTRDPNQLVEREMFLTVFLEGDAGATKYNRPEGNYEFFPSAGQVGHVDYVVTLQYANAASSKHEFRGAVVFAPHGVQLAGILDTQSVRNAITDQVGTSDCAGGPIVSKWQSSPSTNRIDIPIPLTESVVSVSAYGRVTINGTWTPVDANGAYTYAIASGNQQPSGYVRTNGDPIDLDGDGLFNCNDRRKLMLSFASGPISAIDPRTSPLADLNSDFFVSYDEAVYLMGLLGSPCNCPANIADDAGNPFPSSGTDSGIDAGDYNAFFSAEGFFYQVSLGSSAIGMFCDIADDAGNPLPSTGVNNGVNDGDYNAFFNSLFNC